MNKKLLTLSVAVLAAAVLLAGNQTIKSLNKEDAKSESTTVNEISNSIPATVDSSTVLPSESKAEAKSVTVENQSPAPSEKQPEEKIISASETEAIALGKAGFSASEVYDKEVDLDYKKGAWVYEVSFEKDYIDYEYIIDAVSGEVLYSKSEPEYDYNKSVPATEESKQPSAAEKSEVSESRISAKEAEAIALKKAGFSASEVYDKDVELDYERGSWVYEVSFEKDRTDYEYIIDAVSGEILHSEADID